MSKGINKDSMSSLLDGLTSVKAAVPEVQQPESPAATAPSREKGKSRAEAETISKGGPKERICTSIDTTVMNKIRAISEKEGVLINELITVGLEQVISKYEEVHGQVRPKKANKGKIENIFR